MDDGFLLLNTFSTGTIIADESIIIGMNKLEEIVEEDFIDEQQEENREEYLQAVMSLGIPEDEAEVFLEDMGL